MAHKETVKIEDIDLTKTNDIKIKKELNFNIINDENKKQSVEIFNTVNSAKIEVKQCRSNTVSLLNELTIVNFTVQESAPSVIGKKTFMGNFT